MIKDILLNLNKEDVALLKYAFEQDFSQEVHLPDGTFVGVNIYNTVGVEILDQANNWIHGRR